jgi:hypothetical protein
MAEVASMDLDDWMAGTVQVSAATPLFCELREVLINHAKAFPNMFLED